VGNTKHARKRERMLEGVAWTLRLGKTSHALHTRRPAPFSGTSLLDHIVGLEEDRRGYRETKRLGGFEVKDQLEFCGLLYR
jgi:hypothetical protein